MSMEEDTELRDLISQTLEANGCFAKIRAQLRASIFLALDEDDSFQKTEFLSNKKLRSSLETEEGKLMFCIVREFLEQFDLEFTISVFEPESYMGSSYEYIGRQKLIENLKIPSLTQESSDPILLQLLHLCKLNDTSNSTEIIDGSLSSLNCKNESISQSNYNQNNSIIMAANNSDASNKSVTNNSCTNILNETFQVEKKVSDRLKYESPFLTKKTENQYKNVETELDETPKENLLIDLDKSICSEDVLDKIEHLRNKSSMDVEFSPPIVKDLKYSKLDSSFDKLKLCPAKGEKVKTKTNLNSLSDLPPIQISKSRTNDMLLPSLYTKEFKDRSNIKDIDKLFDLEPMDNYEEDFLSESEIDLAKSKQQDITRGHVVGEPQENIMEKKSINENTSTSSQLSTLRDKKHSLDASSTSSITSENFELNSNVDDIFNSC
ncbi:hypothetical protein Trydic_g16510 [Trypoxylus dichotomus]